MTTQTDKETVLAKFPNAHAWLTDACQSLEDTKVFWRVSTRPARYTTVIGEGYGEEAAWADAARRLK